MKIFYFLKHYKYFVCILFSILMLNVFVPFSVKGDEISHLFRFTLYDSTETPYLSYSDVVGDFYTYLNIALKSRSDLSLSVRYTQLIAVLDSLGLSSYFTNWNPYNPQFYCNVNFTNRNGFNVFYFSFVKYNVSLSDISLTSSSSYYNLSTPYGFIPLYHRVLPSPFILNISNSVYNSGVGMDTDFYGSPSSYSSDVTLGYDTYSLINNTSGFSSAFSDFLSDPDSFTFGLFIVFSDDWSHISSRDSFFVNEFYRGFSPLSNSYDHCLLGTYSTFIFNDNSIRVSTSSLFGGNYLSLLYYLYVSPNEPILYEYSPGFSSSGASPSNPTPTPIPTRDWVTPTPFPSVTPVPVTLTPIPQYINPDIDIDSTEIKSSLSGYLDIIDNTFGDFAIFALGSQVLTYLYSFSPYFSFVLLIPAICLIAYAIGRLNQK